MGKPPGVSLTMDPDGPRLRVTESDLVMDEIWDAVHDAVDHGWTVERFRAEAREAWAGALRQKAEWDDQKWRDG